MTRESLIFRFPGSAFIEELLDDTMFDMIDLLFMLKKLGCKQAYCIRYNDSLAFVITRGWGDYFRCPIPISFSMSQSIPYYRCYYYPCDLGLQHVAASRARGTNSLYFVPLAPLPATWHKPRPPGCAIYLTIIIDVSSLVIWLFGMSRIFLQGRTERLNPWTWRPIHLLKSVVT